MGLQGDTRTISLVSLLQMIGSEEKTGVLLLHSGKFDRRLFVHKGQLIFMMSNDPRDFLGHFLVSKGVITEEILGKALEKQSETKNLLGAILSEMKVISEGNLKEQLTEKIKESFYQTFLFEPTAFELKEEPIQTTEFPDLIPIPIQPLLMEAVRRVDEYKQLRKIFPDLEQTYKINAEKLTDKLKQSRNTKKILALLEKGSSIEEVCFHFHTFDYTILKYLIPLHEAQVLEKASLKKSAPLAILPKDSSIESLIEMANTEFLHENYEKATEIFSDILKIDPANDYARQCLKEIHDAVKSRITEQDFSLFAVPKLAADADYSVVEMTAIDGFILSRIDGRLEVGQILSIVPLPEAEALAALKKLVDAGIIEITGR